MNTLQLAWLDHWDEEVLAAEILGFVRAEGRLPDYGEIVSRRGAVPLQRKRPRERVTPQARVGSGQTR